MGYICHIMRMLRLGLLWVLLTTVSGLLYAQDEAIPLNNYLLKDGERPDDKLKGRLFIQVTANKQSCYVGEPITLTYQLCSAVKNLSTTIRPASFNGFSSIDMPIPDWGTYGFQRIKGQVFRVFTLRKVQLYPLQPGALQPGGIDIDHTIYFLQESYLRQQPAFAINPGLYASELLEKIDNGTAPAAAFVAHKTSSSSSPLTIQVKDHPAANKPAGFDGATGQFNIAASVALKNITTDETGKLIVSISGAGNMMLITPPDIAWPEGLEASEATVVDRVSHTTAPVSGSKFFEYQFVTAKPGRYTLPPLSLHWFDPKKGRYQTASTTPIEVEVQPGTGKPATIAAKDEAGQERFFNKLFANRWWVAGPVIGLILLGLGLWVRNEHRKDKRAAVAKATEAREKAVEKPAVMEEPAHPLAGAAAMLQHPNTNAFYQQLNNNLRLYLSGKLQLPSAQLSKKTMAEVLDKHAVSPDTVNELLQVLEAIEWQLYTPVADAAEKETLYHRSLAVLESIKYQYKLS
jgi:hypothetical protein